jgi:uncharacterized protein (TIGR03083 family)
MQMVCEGRADFADLLAGLSPQQWEQPSLCERWRVKDIVAHVLSYDEVSRGQLVWRFVKGGLWSSRINAIGVAEYATRSLEELTELMRACIPPRRSAVGFRRHDRRDRRDGPSARHPATARDSAHYSAAAAAHRCWTSR